MATPFDGGRRSDGAGLPFGQLTGFENHGGVTRLGPSVRPLARVVTGVGNGDDVRPDGSRTEGAWAGRVVGTYMHGPVLARNPALADLLLALATGRALEPLDDEEESALHDERIAFEGPARPGSMAGQGDGIHRDGADSSPSGAAEASGGSVGAAGGQIFGRLPCVAQVLPVVEVRHGGDGLPALRAESRQVVIAQHEGVGDDALRCRTTRGRFIPTWRSRGTDNAPGWPQLANRWCPEK